MFENIGYIITAAACVATISGYVINFVILFHKSKADTELLKKDIKSIEKDIKSNYELIFSKLDNFIRSSENEDKTINERLTGINNKINKSSDEIYTRLRQAESCVQKHCKVLDDMDKLCELKHKAFENKET